MPHPVQKVIFLFVATCATFAQANWQSCAIAIKNTVFARIAPDLKPRVEAIAAKLIAMDSANPFSGIRAAVLLEGMGIERSTQKKNIDRVLAKEIKAIRETLHDIEPQSGEHLAEISKLVSHPLGFAHLTANRISATGEDLIAKWSLRVYNRRAITLDESAHFLGCFKHRGKLKALSQRIYLALQLANFIGDDEKEEALLIALIHTGNFDLIARAGALIRHDDVLIELAVHILTIYFQNPVDAEIELIYGALSLLDAVKLPHYEKIAHDLLYDFARHVTRADFSPFVGAKETEYYNRARMQSELLGAAFNALFFLGEPVGYFVDDEGDVSRRRSLSDPQAKALLRELAPRLRTLKYRRYSGYDSAHAALEAAADSQTAAALASELLEAARSKLKQRGRNFLLAARYFFLARQPNQARRTIKEFLNTLCSDFPLQDFKVASALSVFASESDRAGMDLLIEHLKQLKVIKDTGVFTENDMKWLSLKNLIELLRNSPSPESYMTHFFPWGFYPLEVQPWIQVELTQVQGPSSNRRRGQDSIEFVFAGKEHFADEELEEAMESFAEALYRPGIILVADYWASSSDPDKVAKALQWYAYASRLPQTKPFSDN